ncbi:DUF5518 domain-containing protein [Halorientalis litorea]|jgi:hypothetical protein|uniref:DUF5518 domain-containing protein n=1 Tax=Halorientalis litorea TaxID=2931977 RepID=UPI001FF62497|nr:DUF5518 domain-containing protein [Halorientalis litorea]
MVQPSLPDPRTDTGWRYAIVAGGLAGTYTLLEYLLSTGTTLRLSPVVFAGLLGGLLFVDADVPPRRVGLRTGLVASVPLVWPFVDLLRAIPAFTQPLWFDAVQYAAVAVAVGLFVLFTVVVTQAGAVVGAWLAAKVGPDRPAATAEG